MTPLTLRELGEVAAMDGTEKLEWMDFSAVPTNVQDIMQYFGCLALINDDGDEVVGLAHYSVQEYLVSPRILKTEVAEFYAGGTTPVVDIAKVCLTYVCLQDFNILQPQQDEIYHNLISDYALLPYAASNWLKHYGKVPKEGYDDLYNLAYDFFSSSALGCNFETWQQVWRRTPLGPVEIPDALDFVNNLKVSKLFFRLQRHFRAETFQNVRFTFQHDQAFTRISWKL